MKIKEKGFTLIELLVVIIILSILLAVAIPLYTDAIKQDKSTTRLANLKSIEKLIEAKHPKPEEATWPIYIAKDIGNIPICPYTGKPFQMLTGTVDTTNPDNICKVAYHKIDNMRYILTSYHFIAGWYKEKTIRIKTLHYHGDCKSEYVEIENYGKKPVSLNGWTLSDTEGSYRYIFTFFTKIAPYTTITVNSSPKVQSIGVWNRGCTGGIWNNSGDTAVLKDNNRKVVDTAGY